MIRVCTFLRPFQLLLFVCVSLACAGCWEEVYYQPNRDDPGQVPAPPQAEADGADMGSGETILGDSATAESSEPERPAVEAAATQPDEPLATVLNAQGNLSSETDSPAPPAELDWLLNDSPAPGPAEQPEAAALRQNPVAAWQVGSQWSLAAAYFAKGLDVEKYRESLEQASFAARLLTIDLPALPEISDQSTLQAAVVRYLLEEGGPQLVDQLDEKYSADHGALAALAIKTHALLLVYTPGNKDLEPLISSIRLAAENSGLPENAWRSLVDLLQQRADFASIKQAVFALHDQAAKALAGTVGE